MSAQHQTIRVIDLETENHEHLGRKASPWHPENYIVAAAWLDYWPATESCSAVREHYFTSKEESLSTPWFNLEGVDVLVAHNATFELLWFMTTYREELEKFLKRGGQVHCTALAEYLLSHQTELYPTLDETAPKYGGSHKVDGVKVLWEQGYLTSQIDKDLLMEYLSGPEGDVVNTFKTYWHQRVNLQAANMWTMYLHRCDSLIACAYAEFFGMYVDKEIAHANLEAAEEELAVLRERLEKHLPELPEHFEFNWGSDYHVSALLFGGECRYRDRVPRFDKEGKPLWVKVSGYYFGETFIPEEQATPEDLELLISRYGQPTVFKSGKNKGHLKLFKEDTDEQQQVWDDDSRFQFAGIVKPQDLPGDVATKFFGHKAEYVGKRALPCGTPVYSTAEEALQLLAVAGVDAAKDLIAAAALDKDIGTYYHREVLNKDGSVKKTSGMLQYVGEDSIVHHSLNVTSTVTGRLSSARPNLQNLPRKGTSKVKQMFTSRWGAQGRIIEVDYSALEVVVNAAMSKCPDLCRMLDDNIDMHCYRLAFDTGEEYEDVLEWCTNEDHPKHTEWKEKRSAIKVKAFSAQYGASAAGIAYSSGSTLESATRFLDNEEKLFPGAIAFRGVIREAVEITGDQTLHREQDDHGNWRLFKRGYWQSPGGTCYSFRQLPKWFEGKYIMDYKDTQIANYWCQGEGGYFMAVSFGRIMRWLLANNWFDNHAFLVNNVHDAAYADAHETVAPLVAKGMEMIMADIPKYASEHLGYDIAEIKFPAEAELGLSMYDKRKLV